MPDGPKITNSLTFIDQADKPATVTAKASVRARLVEKIRSELNIEKWPAIWQPAKSKNKPALRVMERELPTSDGNRVLSRVEIGYTHLGTLTTEEQKMFYVLIRLWEEAGKPDKQVFFSSRALARLLKKKGWGTNVITAITKSLRKLRHVPIEWINSYYDRSKPGAVVVDHLPLSLLGDLRIVERRQDGAVNSSLGYFKFDDRILSNLQLNYTKPVCIEEFFKLRSEIAQLIYSHIDLMLFDKTRYERKSRELFDDLGLKNSEYEHMYERKRAIEKALRELQGIRLSSGVIKTATIEKTVDGKDYKVSFSKGPVSERLNVAAEILPGPKAVPVIINDYTKQKDPTIIQAEELVKHFHKIFHRVENHSALSKETSQALTLITQHGLDKAKSVIDFAHTESAKTNFQIQHFGGVLAYASRALAAFDRSKAAAERPARPAAKSARPEQPTWSRGERRFAILTFEDEQARLGRARAELLQKNTFLARWKDGSSIHYEMIRSRVIRELDQECMDIIRIDGQTDPVAICRNLGLRI
jgi:hypothetical protein